MTLISREDDSILMRHSTCRVAFSTVDPLNPTTFCYVALVKDTELALCHVFRAKTVRLAWVFLTHKDLDDRLDPAGKQPNDPSTHSSVLYGVAGLTRSN